MAVDRNSDAENGGSSPSSVIQIIQFKCKACLHSRFLGIIRCVLLVVYSFVGAGIFLAIEGGRYENKSEVNITEIRAELLLALSSNGSASNMSTVEDILQKYDSLVIENYNIGKMDGWDFWKSLFFATTVYTTIGYGNKAPVTKLGRGITMLYAAFGIPLFLLVMGDVGGYLKNVLCRTLRKGWCCKTLGNTHAIEDTKHQPKTVVVTLVAVLIMILYLFLGTLIYTRWEAWTFFETFYFLFISFTTIGFGDIVPAHPKFFLISSPFYVLIGLSIMAMCIDLVKDIMKELSQPQENPSTSSSTNEQSQLLEHSSAI